MGRRAFMEYSDEWGKPALEGKEAGHCAAGHRPCSGKAGRPAFLGPAALMILRAFCAVQWSWQQQHVNMPNPASTVAPPAPNKRARPERLFQVCYVVASYIHHNPTYELSPLWAPASTVVTQKKNGWFGNKRSAVSQHASLSSASLLTCGL